MVLRVRGLSLYLSFCQSACVCLSVCCPIDIYAACVTISSPATRVCMCVHVPVCGVSVLCVPWYQMMSACLGPLPAFPHKHFSLLAYSPLFPFQHQTPDLTSGSVSRILKK